EYSIPPANIDFKIYQAYSKEQLDLSLHASYKGSALEIDGGFNYNKKDAKTRLVAKFIQSYYTIDMDMPQNPSDLFAEEINTDLLGSYAPMYVSTITYGRLALFTIESSLSEDSVRAYLNGSYKNISASASAEFDRLIKTSEMKVYILGGSGEEASRSIDGYESFRNYIIKGGNYSAESPGAPISYKLRNIKDNSVAKIVYAADYPIVEKILKRFKYNFTIDAFKIKDTNKFDDKDGLYTQYPNAEELMGKIKCKVEGTATEIILWQYQGGYWSIAYDIYKELDQDAHYNNTGNPCTRRTATFEGLSQLDSITFEYEIWDFNWHQNAQLIEKFDKTICVSDIINTIDAENNILVEDDKIHVAFKIFFEKIKIKK
ncbi:MAG TPA: thiol-activated cytolysin family protein, partial [Anaerovoracaceae bacterium]|nr:thiol-activated cytolysin family protein [Anaerovoracaceae bacterium]